LKHGAVVVAVLLVAVVQQALFGWAVQGAVVAHTHNGYLKPLTLLLQSQ
jgi:hypothetical protein